MRQYLTFLALIIFSITCFGNDDSVFIPLSPMTATEIDQAKEEFRSDPEMANFDVDDLYGDGTEIFTYRESDVRSALIGLEESDEQLSICSNAVAGGATRIVYLSPARDNNVIVKSASCKQVEGGLNCRPVEEETKYIFKEPKNYFSITGGVTYKEASLLLLTYEKHGITDLPKWYEGFTVSSVRTIGKAPGGYELLLGEILCGCTAKFTVQIEETDEGNRLILLNEPEGVCI